MKMTKIELLKLDKIQPSALNPRKVYDEAALQELADSIKAQGLLNPITVRLHPDVVNNESEPVYEIVCGERRWRAMLLAGLTEIPAIVRELTDDEAFEVMITENLQRKDIEPLDEAAAYLALQGRGLSVTDMAAKFGKSERYVRDRLKLNDLIPIFKEALSHGKLTIGGAVMLARLDDTAQTEMAEDYDLQSQEDWSEQAVLTTQDVKDDIEDNFATLDGAIFLPEDEWNKDQQPRLCSMCANNSSCQQSIWPELAGKARCADVSCFKEKLDRFISYKIESVRERLLPAGTDKNNMLLAPQGSLILYCERPQFYWDDKTRQRTQAVIDRYKKRFLILFNDQIQVEYSDNNPDKIERELAAGDIIEGINLYMLINGRLPSHKYYRLRYPEAEDEGRQKDRLLRRYDGICEDEKRFATDLLRKNFAEAFKRFDLCSDDPILKVLVASCARNNFYDLVAEYKTEDGTIKRLDTMEAIEEWWDTFKDKEQTPYGYALEKLIAGLRIDELLYSIMTRFSSKSVTDSVQQAQAEFEGKKKAIEDELRELGYDTKGDPLPDDETPVETESETKDQAQE